MQLDSKEFQLTAALRKLEEMAPRHEEQGGVQPWVGATTEVAAADVEVAAVVKAAREDGAAEATAAFLVGSVVEKAVKEVEAVEKEDEQEDEGGEEGRVAAVALAAAEAAVAVRAAREDGAAEATAAFLVGSVVEKAVKEVEAVKVAKEDVDALVEKHELAILGLKSLVDRPETISTCSSRAQINEGAQIHERVCRQAYRML